MDAPVPTPQTIDTDQGPFVVHRLGTHGDWVLAWPVRICDHACLLEFGRHLAREHRVVLFDPPGSGVNRWMGYRPSVSDQAFFVLKTMRVLGIDRCHWVGHSVGGVVGSLIAMKSPDRLLSLTLSATPMLRSGQLRVTTSLLLPVLARLAWGRRVLVEHALEDLGYADAAERLLVHHHLIEAVERVSPHTLAALKPLDAQLVRQIFGQLCDHHPPMLVLAGRHDRTVRARDQHTVAEMTGARFVELPCGHMTFLAEPLRAAGAWMDFVRHHELGTLPAPLATSPAPLDARP